MDILCVRIVVHLLSKNLVSPPVYERLREQGERQLEGAKSEVQRLFTKDQTRAEAEFVLAKKRLIAAEISSVEQSLHQGLASQAAINRLIEEADTRLDKLMHQEPASDSADQIASNNSQAEDNENTS